MDSSIERRESVRTVDNQAYLGMLKDLILDGKEVSLTVSGNSMSPFIVHQRDSVLLAPVVRPLRKGDIVFYQRCNAAYVLHRICRVNADGTYDIVGDAQVEIEKRVTRGQIFAAVAMVRRKGRDIRPGNFRWFFFARVWIRIIPLRPFLMRVLTAAKAAKCGWFSENF